MPHLRAALALWRVHLGSVNTSHNSERLTCAKPHDQPFRNTLYKSCLALELELEMEKAVVRLIRDIIGDGKPCSKEEWVTISKALAEANQPSHNNGSTCASQIADSMEAACLPSGGGFISPKESWIKEWCRQLRTCR